MMITEVQTKVTAKNGKFSPDLSMRKTRSHPFTPPCRRQFKLHHQCSFFRRLASPDVLSLPVSVSRRMSSSYSSAYADSLSKSTLESNQKPSSQLLALVRISRSWQRRKEGEGFAILRSLTAEPHRHWRWSLNGSSRCHKVVNRVTAEISIGLGFVFDRRTRRIVW